MATQTPPAAYRPATASADFCQRRVPAPKSRNKTLATRDAALPCRVLNVGGGRHVFDSTIDASSLRGRALPTDAVGRRCTFADRHRTHGCHRPLRRAKAEGRYGGDVANIRNPALGGEFGALAAYQLAADSGLLQKPVLDLAMQFQGQHKAHADLLAK